MRKQIPTLGAIRPIVFANLLPASKLSAKFSNRIEGACLKLDSARQQGTVASIKVELDALQKTLASIVVKSPNAGKFEFKIAHESFPKTHGKLSEPFCTDAFRLSAYGPKEISRWGDGLVSYVKFDTEFSTYDVAGPGKKVGYAFMATNSIEAAVATLKATVETVLNYGKKGKKAVKGKAADSGLQAAL